ncbi:MAG: hypothetical protein B6D63_06825 [Candidatus Latescibacteria bacterium 4484_7]|nr:MAG: hypothetical protein B6D63_06825 [Candidatus Latescibacteria bacterium 4484_7]
MRNKETNIVAKGLNPPGPLLLVKKELKTLKTDSIRVIVSNRESVDELVEYFEAHGGIVELDRVGEDHHIIVDLSNFKDGD